MLEVSPPSHVFSFRKMMDPPNKLSISIDSIHLCKIRASSGESLAADFHCWNRVGKTKGKMKALEAWEVENQSSLATRKIIIIMIWTKGTHGKWLKKILWNPAVFFFKGVVLFDVLMDSLVVVCFFPLISFFCAKKTDLNVFCFEGDKKAKDHHVLLTELTGELAEKIGSSRYMGVSKNNGFSAQIIHC